MGMVIVLVVIVILYYLLTVTQIETLRENDTLCNIWELTWLYTVYKLSVSWSYRSKHDVSILKSDICFTSDV